MKMTIKNLNRLIGLGQKVVLDNGFDQPQEIKKVLLDSNTIDTETNNYDFEDILEFIVVIKTEKSPLEKYFEEKEKAEQEREIKSLKETIELKGYGRRLIKNFPNAKVGDRVTFDFQFNSKRSALVTRVGYQA
jgi:hypothetical protein